MEYTAGAPSVRCRIMEEIDDAALLARVVDGDRAAWSAIVERYERLVWSIVRGFRFNDATSADVTQTVWLRLAEHASRVRQPDRLGSWLASIARNECIAVTRRNRRETTDDALVDLRDVDPGPAVDEGLLDREAVAAVTDAFATLSEDCQALLRLLCTDPPLDYRTVSDLTGRPIGSIGPTRKRCLARLRTSMEELGYV